MSRHLVIMAAGTGGHVIPGLAVAREAQARGWTVSWLGTPQGMENRLVPPTGLPLDRVQFAGLRGKGWRGGVKGAWRALTAVSEAQAIFQARGATAVLGMGGYVCVPGGLAAKRLGLPVTLVNADAAWLMSNRVLLPWAQAVAFGFEGADAHSSPKARVTGNPVRAEMLGLPEPRQRFAHREGPLKLLVVGGSLGARVLNETLPLALARLPEGQRPQVLHQTGSAMAESVRARYAECGVSAQVQPFIDDMALALAECDGLIGRSGAGMVSELCAVGVGAWLLPLVLKTTHHQRDNANWMQDQGAAVHWTPDRWNPEALAQALLALDRPTLLNMAERARRQSRPQATQAVMDLLEGTVSP